MSDALIQIVDENDRPVSVATKQEAWDKGLIHRIVRIMIEDGEGNLLLQKRDAQKELYPNRWDNSCAGHVDAGEDYETAAHRELLEELGLQAQHLAPVDTYYVDFTWQGRKMRRFARLYRLIVDHDTHFKIAPGEVSRVEWFPIKDIRSMIVEYPDQVTDGLIQVIERYYENNGDQAAS